MVGLMLSVMVTVNELVAILPFTSVAVYITVVTPAGKVDPLVWLEVRDAMPQLSLAVGAVQVATLSQVPIAIFMVMLEGVPVMTGSSLSLTVMVNEPVAMLPAASVAV